METGRLIGQRYRLGRVLGAGGMGVVYLAHDEREPRSVAVKILAEDPTDDPQRRKRFLREAWAVSQLSHPYIVRVYERGEEPDGCAWMAMEYIDGTSFGAVLDRGPLPLRDVANVLVPVARALGAAHRAGFVHRDVKPENILVCGDGRPVLVDFGITRTISHHAVNRGTVDQLTRTGMLVGTPEYMSPEQVRGHDLDGRSDQFSLAVVCFEALTGRRPFFGDNPMATIAAVLTDPVPPVTDLAPGVPREVGDGIARALSKRPADRFPDIDAFATLLEAFMPTSLSGIDLRALERRRPDPDVRGPATVMDVESDAPRAGPTTEPRRPSQPPASHDSGAGFDPFSRTVVESEAPAGLSGREVTAPEVATAMLARPSLPHEAPDADARTTVRASPLVPAPPPGAGRAAPDVMTERLDHAEVRRASRIPYSPLQPPPTGSAPRRRGRALLGLVALLGVGALVGALLLALR